MTGPGRNRLLSALLISALAFFLITVSSLFSVDARMPVEEKTEGKVVMTEPEANRTIMWQDGFKDDIKFERIHKDSKEGYTGWKVGVAWLKEQIRRYEDMQAQVADPEEYSYFVFIVTRDKKAWGDHKNEKIVDPNKHRLWIRGFRNPESFAEDFPPIQWP